MKRKNLVLLVGIPGVGKTTWLRTHLGDGDAYVSRDEVRFSIISDNEDYFSHETEVFNTFVTTIEENLNKGLRVFADATHISWPSRRKLLEHIHNKEDIDIDVYVFLASLDICLKRNAEREGRARVPEQQIRKMYRSMSNPMTDPFKYHFVQEIYTEGGTNVKYVYHTIGENS